MGHVRALVIPDDRQQSSPLPAAQRVSIQAELVRLGARFFIKRSTRPEVSIAERRRRLHAYERWIPQSPAAIETLKRVLGGVPAIRVVPPEARPGHHILYLHGGGYVAGSPALYRHLTWRFAAAAGASLAAIDYRLAPEHPFPASVPGGA